jgi:hypothetical protein
MSDEPETSPRELEDAGAEPTGGNAGGDVAGAGGSSKRLRWGLLPESREGESPTWADIFHHWFVRYNPLYFFSAAFILGGISLVSRGLGETGAGTELPVHPQILLAGITQIYEFGLIASAAFLARRLAMVRPAVLLGLAEMVFLLDCTFRLESVALLGTAGTVAVAVWMALVPLKVWLLACGIGFRMPVAVFGAVTLAGIGTGTSVYLLSLDRFDRAVVVLAAASLGAILTALVAHGGHRLRWPQELEPLDARKLERINLWAIRVLTGMYFYHLVSYVLWVDDGRFFGVIFGIAWVMGAMLRPSEKEVWVLTVLSLGSAATAPVAVAPIALLAAIGFVLQARRSGNSRMLVGAIALAYLCVWTFGWTGGTPPRPPWMPGLVTAAALAFAAWRLRSVLACVFLAGGATLAFHLYGIDWRWLFPTTTLAWGILLLFAGFVALAGGVWINWYFRGDRRAPEIPASSERSRPSGRDVVSSQRPG